MLYLGADHAGWTLKENLKVFLAQENIPFQDLGADTLVPDDDFPAMAVRVARAVVADKTPDSRGLLICGSGIGVCIAANKIAGVRAGLGYSLTAAAAMRTDDDANIICLAGRVLQPDFARAIVRTFLQTKFSGAERHVRRLQEITEMETKTEHLTK